MRALIQRVAEAAVRVDGRVVGAIGPGLLVLAGIAADDTAADRDWLARKIVAMRIFADAAGVMNRSVQETGGDIHYTSALGLPALREAIARHYADRFGVSVAPERIVVTAGSSAALLLVMALLVDRDDAILMADPSYPCNRNFVRVVEGEASSTPRVRGVQWRSTRSAVSW